VAIVCSGTRLHAPLNASIPACRRSGSIAEDKTVREESWISSEWPSQQVRGLIRIANLQRINASKTAGRCKSRSRLVWTGTLPQLTATALIALGTLIVRRTTIVITTQYLRHCHATRATLARGHLRRACNCCRIALNHACHQSAKEHRLSCLFRVTQS
jgi:hypothetical protein